MKVLVTGANGRVGANLVKALLEKGHQVRAFLFPGDASRSSKLDAFEVEKIEGDLRNEKDVARAVEGMEVIYHLAAAMGGPFDAFAYMDINVRGTLNILEAARSQKHLSRLVYASTDAVYPSEHKSSQHPQVITEESEIRPTMPYSMTKWLGERLVIGYHQQYGLPTVALRFAHVIGPGELFEGTIPGQGIWLSKVLEALRSHTGTSPEYAEVRARLEAVWPGEERLLVTYDANGMPEKLSVVDIRDLVQWLLAAMHREEAIGEMMNVPGPEPVRWEVAVPLISERLGIPYCEVTLPLVGPPFVFYCETSHAKAHRLLGYRPVHGVPSMLDLAMDMREGKEVGLIPTGVRYGPAQ